jgi:hypothetical protein
MINRMSSSEAKTMRLSSTKPNADLQATAYHEAGHAVVSLALGLAIDRISIAAGRGYTGSCTGPSVLGYEAANPREQRSIARALILSCYAGMHAQRLVDADAPEEQGFDDDADAFNLSSECAVLPRSCQTVGDEQHIAYLDRLRAEAGRLVRRHQQAIRVLAETLLRRHELNASAAQAIVQRFFPRRRIGPRSSNRHGDKLVRRRLAGS